MLLCCLLLCSQEIQLSEMLAVDPPVSDTSLYLLSPLHVFEIVTSDSNFFCGVDLDGGANVADIQVFPQAFIVDRSMITHTHACAHTHTHTYTRTDTHTHIHTRTHTHARTRARAHTHTHTHTHKLAYDVLYYPY